jgi:hypothetical protein
MTQSGNEVAIFRHVMQCLNLLRYRGLPRLLDTIQINFKLQREDNWKTSESKCQTLYCISPHTINQGTSPGRETQVSQQGSSQFGYTICLQEKTLEISLIT